MPGRIPTNEGIGLTKLHPAYTTRSRDGFYGPHGSQMYEWPGDSYETWKRFTAYNSFAAQSIPQAQRPGESYETWKRFTTYNNSSAQSIPLAESPPLSLHRSNSNRSSIISNDSARSSFEVPIVQQRLSYPVPKQSTGSEVIIDFDGKDDPYRPINWPFRKKMITTFLYGFTTCWITFASAIYSAGAQQIADEFHVSVTVATAGISMVVFGFGLGPMLWGPLSEVCSTYIY